jgi:hypothetical protein
MANLPRFAAVADARKTRDNPHGRPYKNAPTHSIPLQMNRHGRP